MQTGAQILRKRIGAMKTGSAQWRRGVRLVWAACVFMLAALPAGSQATVTVQDARIGDHGGYTRIVFDLSKPVPHKSFTLADPYRVVIDMAEADFQINPHLGEAGGGLIQRFRYGLFQPGNSRVVLDLKEPAKITKEFSLPGQGGKGARLVIDLVPIGRAAFLETAGFPKQAFLPEPREKTEVTIPPPAHKTHPVIVIDPGHGGVDPGAIGRSGLKEKNVVFDTSQRLARVLQKSGRYEVRMTRDRDVFVPLRERVRRGRNFGADLFISIHADAAENPKAHGAGVYTLSENASDKEAAALARRENRADIIAGVNLSGEPDEVASILIDLAQRETKNKSVYFASTLVPYLKNTAQIRSRTHRFAGFAVLKAPDVPSVLIELGFLTNQGEERALSSANHREKLAHAIAEAVDRYFSTQTAWQ